MTTQAPSNTMSIEELAKRTYNRERQPDTLGFRKWERASRKVKDHYRERAMVATPTEQTVASYHGDIDGDFNY